MDLLPQDYQWITEKIYAVARVCCGGRIVSVLEGGYGRHAFDPKTNRVNIKDRSNLAQNCCAHVRGLVGQ